MKMFMSDGPLNWQVARQAALVVSTGGQPEPNVDPLDRLRLEELLRIADLHIADATGLATSQTGKIVAVKAVTRAEWAYHTLDHYRPLFEGLAGALAPPASSGAGDQAGMGEAADPFGGLFNPADPESGLLGSLPQVLGPVFLGAQAGSLCGHLATQAMGQYDVPVPRPLSDELMMVPAALTAFADDWSLPADDVRLWVCLSELTHHAVLGRPHVLFNNPEVLLGAVTTPGQRDVEARLAALVSAIEGYVDHIVDTVGSRLIGGHGPLSEAMRRRRVEASDTDDMLGQLFGLELSQAAFERGGRFVTGVIERAGDAGLSRLWLSERELPTPAEIDAPGLWLERIDIPG
jgi:uncharacterized protein (DUF2342 family)